MSGMRFFVPIFVILTLSVACTANGADLSKTEAAKIMTNMGVKNVKIGAIVLDYGVFGGVLGEHAASSQNVAFVLAVWVRDGDVHADGITFFYDKDMGWFYVETVKNSGVDNKLKFWTANGYSEVTTKP